jgi:hypothetical protein
MNEAIVVFSRKGLFKTGIKARDVRSREHARKLWPLVAPDPGRQLLTWVSPSFEGGKLRRRSHFRRLPAEASYDLKARFDEEEAGRWHEAQESPAHRKAKALIAAELSRRIAEGLALPWSFKDPEASDYPLEGNLLLGADQIAVEMPLKTPFGSGFRLDIAVVGPPVQKAQVVLGGIEIEMSHAFDGRKALIRKSLGFPLISIDIADMNLDEITPEWARGALSATTRSSDQGRRQTYVYLHDLLYPLHAQLPAFLDNEQRHQFLIFADDKSLHALVRWIGLLAKTLNYANGAIAIALVNGKSEQSRKMLERAGSVGHQGLDGVIGLALAAGLQQAQPQQTDGRAKTNVHGKPPFNGCRNPPRTACTACPRPGNAAAPRLRGPGPRPAAPAPPRRRDPA